MDETPDILPTWGYQPDGAARIFDLAPGEALPEGWFASPDCITDPSLATADAVTARAARRPYEPVPAVADAVPEHPLAEMEALVDENERLKAIIATGSSENERLVGEIEAAEAELEAMGTEVANLRELLTKAQADGGFAIAERDEAQAALDKLAGELVQARADLDAATAPKATKAAK